MIDFDGRRVLVVEDEFLIALEIETVLQDAGAHVAVAPGVPQGKAFLDGPDAFDAAVLDVRLGDHDVFPLADLLAERGIPFLFHSGHARRIEMTERYPDVTVITKPTSRARLLSEVAKLCGVTADTVAA